jgi:hypothetical protein
MASTNDSLSGDLTDPTAVACACLVSAKAVLALMHPRKQGLSLLGLNKTDGILHGFREWCDIDQIIIPVGRSSCEGKPAEEI